MLRCTYDLRRLSTLGQKRHSLGRVNIGDQD